MKWLSVVLLAVAASGACTVAAADGVLDIVAPWEITSIDPSTSGYVFTRMQVAETLIEVDADGQPVPGLAAAWQVSEDRHLWRFTLRPGVRFHDGSLVTADAVVASLEQARAKPGVLSQAPIESIAVTAEDELAIHLASPFAPLWALLAHTSTQILASASYDGNGEVTRVIGTGPYQVDELAPPQRMTVRYFEGYWGVEPTVKRASYLAAGRGETRALMAESGDADVVFTLDPASEQRLRRNPALQVHSVAIPRTLALKINAGHPFLAEPAAREALSLAIDRQGIATAILRTPQAAANQMFPPALGGWHVASLGGPTHDPAGAQALLAGLGWAPGADGMLQRDGEPFQVTLRTFTDRPELPLIAASLQDQFRAVGIDMQVAIGNSSDIPAGHRDGSLELALMARNFGLIPDPLGTLLQDFGPDGGDWGAMNWSDTGMTDALAGLVAATDADEVARQRRQVSDVLLAQRPVIPVAWYQHTAAVSATIEGFSIDPLERSYRITDIRWAP